MYIERNDRGTVTFAKFEANGSADRKLENDVVFLKSVLEARTEDDFRLKREDVDSKLGLTHRRYQQYYRGVKVDNAEYLTHARNGIIEYINGDFRQYPLGRLFRQSMNDKR